VNSDDKLKRLMRVIDKDVPVTYERGEYTYVDVPRNMKVKRFYYNPDREMYVGVLSTKVSIFVQVLLILSVTAFAYSLYSFVEAKREEHFVVYDKIVFLHNGYVSLNVVNPPENSHEVRVQLLGDKGKYVTEEITLQPGEEVGSIKVINTGNLSHKSGVYTLKYVIGDVEAVRLYTVVLSNFEED